MADVLPIKGHREFERQTKRSAAGVLRQVRERARPTEVLVIGLDEDGQLFVQSSPTDPANALWLMELAKQKITGLR